MIRTFPNPDDYGMFIYPDFKTCLAGTFEDLEMLSAVEARVVSLTEDHGILVPCLSAVKSPQVVFKKEDMDPLSICDHPDLRDPFESEWVEVKESRIPGAGEGLFCREDRSISEGRVVAYFNGAVRDESQRSEYSIALDDRKVLDIPEGIERKLFGAF
jgi:hypothetical protein